MNTQQKKPHVTLALINGQILRYDGANPARWSEFYTTKYGWEYLGEGVIWSINGVMQVGSRRLHFWRRKFELESVEGA